MRDRELATAHERRSSAPDDEDGDDEANAEEDNDAPDYNEMRIIPKNADNCALFSGCVASVSTDARGASQ